MQNQDWVHLQNPEEIQLLRWFSCELPVLFILMVIGGNKQKFETFLHGLEIDHEH